MIKDRLNSTDFALLALCENLTGRAIEPKAGIGFDNYFFEVDYVDNLDADWLAAVFAAIEGKAGERLMELYDDPDRHAFFVRMRLAEKPISMRRLMVEPPRLGLGEKCIFRRHGEVRELRYMRVDAGNINDLIKFVGNGEFVKVPGQMGVFSFLNCGGMVFKDCVEGDYIIFVGFDRFIVVTQDEFNERTNRNAGRGLEE